MKKLLLFFMSLFTFLSYGQLSEDFEGATFPPTGWVTFDNGIGLTRSWTTTTGTPGVGLGWVYAGTKSAIIFKENQTPDAIAEDWMVTRLVTVPTNGQLRFFARSISNGEQGSVYKVKLSTVSQNNPADFTTTLATYSELDIINASSSPFFQQKTISLTAYAGQSIYIAFVMENDNGDAWIVDNVNVDQECIAIPSALTATPSNTSANLAWTYTGPATQFEIEYGPAGFVQGTGTVVSPVSNPYNLTGLTAATNYTYYVRALCGSGIDNPGPWSTSMNFTTTLCPAIDRCDFIFRLTDSWPDGWNGATMQVRQAGVVVATIGATFTTGAVIDITVPLCNNQPYELFWNNGGGFPSEVGVQIIDPLVGTVFTMPSSSGALVNTILYSSTAFCTPPTCPRPSAVVLSAIGQTQASVNWTENGPATQWQVLVLPASSPVPTAATPGWQTTSTRPYIYTGLASGTQYKAYVRSICSAGVDESIVSVGTTFATLIANDDCINATVAPVNDNASCSNTVSGTVVGATASTDANTCPGSDDDDVWFQFTAVETSHLINLTNVSGSTTNLDFVVYSGSCGTLAQLFCSPDNSNLVSGLVPGQNYFVRVYTNTGTPNQTTFFDFCVGTVPTCENSDAFCGGSGFVYSNSTGVDGYGSVACLGSTDNPAWFFMQVSDSGSLELEIVQTDSAGFGLDVDFVCWGPFNSTNYCNMVDLVDCPTCPNNTTNPNFYPFGNIADCSYSAVSIENINIANAIAGDIYVVLITNFSDDPGTVTFTQTGGTGATNCDIVCSLDLGADQVFCDTASHQITASNLTADNYVWYFNNVLIPGVNTSSITVSQTGTYKCIMTCGINEVEDEISLTFNTAVVPTFTAIATFCENTVAPVLPTTSTNGIPGAWTPSVISNTTSGSYTFTPNTGICASPVTISVTVTPQVTPSFITPASICAGDAAPVLPTTSNNGVVGTWTPGSVDNMNSAIYTFTPNAGQCATTTTLNVDVIATCTFGTVASAVMIDNCSTAAPGEFFNTTSGSETIGAAMNVFPSSNLGTYVQNSGNLFFNGAELRTFKTATSNVCSANLNYRIYDVLTGPGALAFTVVNLSLFDTCGGATYPTGGNCNPLEQKWQNVASTIDMTLFAPGNYIVEVFYDVVGDDLDSTLCRNTILLNNNGANYKASFSIQATPSFVSANPTTCNGTQGSITISGFNPGETYSITYTDDTVTVGPANFIANVTGDIIISGLNAGTYADFNFIVNGCTITDNTPITLVNPAYASTFNQIGPFCVGDAIVLPTTSIEGYTGSWSPVVDNTQTTTYIFTPDSGQCAMINNSYVVTVNATPSLTSVTATTPICIGQDAVFTVTGTPNTTLDYNLNSGITQSIPIPASGTVSITVTSPAVGNVILNLLDIDNGSCNTTLTNTTTVVVRALPTVTALTAINSSICLGSDAAFTITGTANATVTYQIDGGTSQTVVLNAAGQSGTITITNPTVDVVVLLVDINDGVCNAIITDTITIVVNSVPVPTIDAIVQPTCAVQTASFNVLSPLNSLLNTPGGLFISEVTDADSGALTYVEVYNGTGATVDLSNYKLKVHTNGNPVASAACSLTLSGLLLNNDVVVIKLSTSPNTGGVVPDLSFTTCSGVNNNDNIRLATIGDVDLDSWGRIDGIRYTPSLDVGYTYRRNATAPLPSLVWDPADWTALDPEDYSDVGYYSLYISDYEYILNDGTTTTTQTSTSFSGVAPGTYTLIAHDLLTGCFSEALTFTINGVSYTNPVTNISYVTPVCVLATTNPLPDTSIAGFTSNGEYTISSTDATINSITGEIDLATSAPGTYMVTYSFEDAANCINLGSSQFQIVITASTSPVTDFTYTTPVCILETTNPLPDTSIAGFTSNGKYTISSTNATIDEDTGEIDLATSAPGTYTVTYYIGANATSCVNQGSSQFEIVITASTSPVTDFTYTTPVCILATTNPLPNTSIAGFTSNGEYTISSTDATINITTGEIDLATSAPGTYMVTYTVFENAVICLDEGYSQFEIVIAAAAVPTFNSIDVCNNSQVQLPSESIEGYTGTWSPASIDTSVAGTTIYYFTPSNFCNTVGELTVTVNNCTIPKGISPNGDGKNDNWDLSSFDVRSVQIFNRYGKEVYSKSNYTNEWVGKSNNGNDLPDGTYYYVIEFNDMDSRTGWIYINKER